MEHFYYVYKITCLMDEWNGMFYIGKHFGKVDDNYAGSGRLIREYFAKYGKVKDVTYIKEIINYGTEDNICDLEREYIREGMKSELCLNLHCMSCRGFSGKTHNNETRKRMSVNNCMHNKDIIQKMVNSSKGKIVSEETRMKISKALKGKPKSEEAKINMCLNHADFSGQNNPMSRTNREKRRNNG